MTATLDAGPHQEDGASAQRAAEGLGRTELGTISVDPRVVEKIAARAAGDVPDAGGSASRGLGRSLPGGHDSSLDSLPKVRADVDGSIATLSVTMSVRWPASIAGVSDAVRAAVREAVHTLTGLQITDVDIAVTDLVTHFAPPPRVR